MNIGLSRGERQYQCRWLGGPSWVVSVIGLIAAAVSGFGQDRAAAPGWISLRTPAFNIDTTKDQAAAAEDLRNLQDIRSFFVSTGALGATAKNISNDLPTKVISFRSKAEYAPYAFRAEGGGYYIHTYQHDYIVVSDIGAGNRALVSHEFTHCVITQLGLKLPVWLNEGLAELYSTAEPNGSQWTVGRPPARYLAVVRDRRWIPWETLFALSAESPIYNGGENIATLYAQSWLLTDMLVLNDEYAGHFQQFLLAISAGQTTSQALRSVYQKSVAELGADLSAYIRQRSLPLVTRDGTSVPSTPPPVMARPSDFDLRFALADILSARLSTAASGEAQLTELAALYPQRPEPEEALGILAIQQEQKQAARRHFALAVQRHTKSAEILYRYASLEMEAGTASDSVSALLKRALQLKPDYDAARLELGLIDYTDDDFEAAIPLLSSLNALSLDAEYQVYYTLAECFLNLEKDPESRQYADKASQAAKSPEEKRKLSVLLVKLRSDETAVARSSGVDAPVIPSITQSSVVNVRGHTRELLCSGGQKRLLIDVQGHDLILDISDPQLVVRHPSPDFSAWQCGPLTAEELTVVYTPQAGPGGTTQKVDGKAVELIF